MRPVVFVVFAAILLVIALAYPVSYGPSWAVTRLPIEPESLPQCFRLAYMNADSTYLPTHVGLTSGIPKGISGHYAAVGSPVSLGRGDAWWRQADDSVDIIWYHSPVLRLAAGGDTLRGRGVPTGVASLAELIISPPRDFVVQAIRVSCAAS